jgi:hypothetical protein
MITVCRDRYAQPDLNVAQCLNVLNITSYSINM